LYFISHQSCCIHFHLVIYKALDVYYTYTKTDNIAYSEQRREVALHQLGQIIEDKDTFKSQLWFESNEKGLLKDEIAILTSENEMLREKVELLEKVKELLYQTISHHIKYIAQLVIGFTTISINNEIKVNQSAGDLIVSENMMIKTILLH